MYLNIGHTLGARVIYPSAASRSLIYTYTLYSPPENPLGQFYEVHIIHDVINPVYCYIRVCRSKFKTCEDGNSNVTKMM